jgi:hypothetical protein
MVVPRPDPRATIFPFGFATVTVQRSGRVKRPEKRTEPPGKLRAVGA